MKYQNLFKEYDLGGNRLKNRFLMAPMTRSRSSQPGDIPNALMAEYYAQRSTAGLIITEAVQISLQGMGYAKTPGIYSEEQIQGWKLVTEAVHKNGSKIFLQLWHVGRISSSKVNGLQPIAPSALTAQNTSVYIFDGAPNGDATFVPVDEPKEMAKSDIDNVIKEFVQGAKNAIEAGFDGVEIHGANGYLIDQFLRSNSNKRTDEYGGSKENRIRFLIEITKAVVNAVGKEKTGVRLSPFISFKDMNDPEILETIMLAAKALNKLDVAYIHLCEADWDDAPQIPNDFRVQLRANFDKTIIATGNKTPNEGEQLIQDNLVDLIGYGRKFLSNPDYPERVKQNAYLNEISDNHTLFGGGTARGYTDYPFLK
ncbi:N-ethylmaleimide reductase [Flavobacterium nitrogenifigens]|uniref:N-ethylmaleimide reductase n=2 Tax=Flavobacterium TaxID=237 RepID=A0A7W7IYT6_9FLAO|nr:MULTISPECIES: alkene reductase [Flavobacterium]MBB4802632.1 N-ethylmaleimide reductase [Flavobacterium nitrogenifigens]MBB6387590.1 N-ethylmaleimide reductase [Flavobacterium notoginsengisoli]